MLRFIIPNEGDESKLAHERSSSRRSRKGNYYPLFLDDLRAGHAPERFHIIFDERKDIPFIGVSVNHPDDGRERIGDRAVKIEDQRWSDGLRSRENRR